MGDFKDYLNVYRFKVELPGSGKVVKFKPIVFNQLKHILSEKDKNRTNEELELIIDDLITECLEDKNINIMDMYIEDRYFLFLNIRKASKGTKISSTYTCHNTHKVKAPNGEEIDVECGQFPAVINLDDLNIIKPTSLTGELELSNTLKIVVDHNKRQHQHDASVLIDNIKAQDINMTDDEVNMMMIELLFAHAIKAVITPDGVLDDSLSFDDKVALVNNFTETDYENVTNFFRDNSFGYDTNMVIECPHCHAKETVEIDPKNFF